MTTEILKLAKELGKLIAQSDEVKAANAAKEAYENDKTVQAYITEYNAHNKALAEEYKREAIDQKIIDAIEARLDAIVAEVTASETFVQINEAQEAVNALMNEVNAEIEFQITGQRPCSHNCSSCGSDCGHHH